MLNLNDVNYANIDIKDKIARIHIEQHSREVNRARDRKELNDNLHQLKEIQSDLDKQNAFIQTQLIPSMKNEEEKTSTFFFF